jgi:Na+-transporting NADH:ubiquinone oxidoreductase subunit NqrC
MMNKNDQWLLLPALLAPAVVISAPAYATQYLTVEQAQAALFPEAGQFTAVPLVLTSAQAEAIEDMADVRVRNQKLHVWKAEQDGKHLGWFLVDEVLGKHEFITYAVALDTGGAVQGIEIMDYRESHGEEVRNKKWQAQFYGKQHGAVLKLDEDIQNIGGATLSCKHITDGVKRLLATYETVLK